MISVIDSAILVILLGIVIAIGVHGYRYSRSLSGFYLAGRRLGAWVLAFSFMATYFSAASFLGGGGATYLFNLGFGAWLTAWHVIGVVLAWFLVAGKLFSYAEKHGVLSVPDLLEHRYQSRAVKVAAAVVIVFLYTLYLTSVYKGGAAIISELLQTPYALSLILLAIPVAIYTAVGGFRAAALNNLVLGFLMLIAAFLTFGYVMSAVGGPLAGLEKLREMTVVAQFPGKTVKLPGELWLKMDGMGPPPAMALGAVPMLIMSITFSISMAQLALPTLLMQFYAARDRRVIADGRILGPIAIALYAFLTFSLGAFCHLILDPKIAPTEVALLLKDCDFVIPKAITMLAPSGVRGLIFAAVVAASMSTISVTLIVLSAALVKDLLHTAKPTLSESSLTKLSRIAALAFAAISILLAVNPPGIIVEIVGVAFGTIFACFIGPVTIGLYWRKASKTGAVASMISGLVVSLLWYVILYRTTWIYPVIPAIAFSLIIFIAASYIRGMPREVNVK